MASAVALAHPRTAYSGFLANERKRSAVATDSVASCAPLAFSTSSAAPVFRGAAAPARAVGL